MLKLELSEKELEAVKYNKESIRSLILSRAIYNESLEYDFTDEELRTMEFFQKTESLKLYIRKIVEPKVMVNENVIIDEYNRNKELFDGQKIEFKEAHDIIKRDLTNQMYYNLEQDFIKGLISEMDDNISLSKNDVLHTEGDPNLLKTVLINTLLENKLANTDFYDENKSDIELISQEIRMNYYVRVINSKNIEITNEEISKFYVDNSTEFENMDLQTAYNQIYNHLFNNIVTENTNQYVESIIEKYDINERVEKSLEKEVIN
ncbi:hypothetical protein [Oceanivirga salmonicida]|uniref:hypothetical protein n=1 Tax=Oceanivirga salmonicida TaxID=1769291 RepID=UPI0008321A83|nr:hypothetical protein [Oceanivirga salmonicida]